MSGRTFARSFVCAILRIVVTRVTPPPLGSCRRAVASGVIAGILLTASTAARGAGPFAFFSPTLELRPSDERALDAGHTLVRILPAPDAQLAVFAAATVRTSADQLVQHVRRIEELKRGKYVQMIHRFSNPPELRDLDALTLDPDDLSDLDSCAPGDCDIKLSADEILELRAALRGSVAGRSTRVDRVYRELVLARVRGYLAEGQRSLPAYVDQRLPLSPADAFGRVIAQVPHLTRQSPAFAAFLTEFPRRSAAGVESFLYWSKEQFGGKPTLNVTHVAILLDPAGGGAPPRVLVAGRQVFATHYTNASLSLTTLLADESGRQYLTYLNQSEIDALGGFFGWLKRSLVERRIRSEAERVMDGLRDRVEQPVR
ncbi:MAG: hypothetical protein U0Q12_26505 [Vicinamibacterales bacterium]